MSSAPEAAILPSLLKGEPRVPRGGRKSGRYTRRVTPRLFVLDRVDSTNRHALAELAAGRAQHLDAWRAVRQTAGRGRRGARWASRPGDSLTMSVVVRGAWPWPGALSLAAGLAVLDAAGVVAGGPVPLAVDWPNDVVWRTAEGARGAAAGGPLVEAPKVAGILIEGRLASATDAADQGGGGESAAYVVGIGVNVRGALDPALRAERPVASLAELGVATSPEELGSALHAALAARVAPLAEAAAGGRAFDAAAGAVCTAYLEAAGLALGAPARVAVHASAPGEQGAMWADGSAGPSAPRTVHEGALRAFGPAGLALEPTAGTSPGALRHVPLEHVAGLAPVY